MHEGSIGTVAHILPFPAVGGTEIATRRVAEAAREHGFEGIAFCRPGADPVRELFSTAGFPVVQYGAVAPSYRAPREFIAYALRLAREFRRRGVSLVHCADILGAYFAGYAGRLAGVPVLCHVRNRYDQISIRDRSFLLPVSRFAFVSHHTWRQFGHRVAKKKGTVLYDGIELPDRDGRERDRGEVRRAFGIPDHAPVVGMVARVAPQKDFPTLISAARRLVSEQPELRFLIVGDRSSTAANRNHFADVRARIESAGIAQQFVFTDHRADVSRFYAAMDVFVLCTHWEGLPLVLLEAMAQELPVVATAVDGVPEVVVEGVTGYLHAHEDADALADRLLLLVQDSDHARRMGSTALEHVTSHFSRQSFVRNVAALYREMLPMAWTTPGDSSLGLAAASTREARVRNDMVNHLP